MFHGKCECYAMEFNIPYFFKKGFAFFNDMGARLNSEGVK